MECAGLASHVARGSSCSSVGVYESFALGPAVPATAHIGGLQDSFARHVALAFGRK